MEDPIAISFKTTDHAAGETLKGELAPEPDGDRGRVDHFLMRTGRPLPQVVVLGEPLALRCRQIDELGGSAFGFDPGAQVIKLAELRYPGGSFQQADFRSLPVTAGSFEGVWSGSVVAHVPRAQIVTALESVHEALRPGGLLFVRLTVGDEEGFHETSHGRVYRVRWDPDLFTQAIGALDFALLESYPLSHGELGMIFRREY